ncbi:carboxyvinyl-carboxyphosphonate phosphorylmutase [Fructilactobacillus frigidiflavus]|uniref:carboxyvinyl-carboxyphosphonate phosphorylmutase n=1 Tax=Fructilactobacillus frigidiflavus TaxID=3242688 RepID=UPI003756C388
MSEKIIPAISNTLEANQINQHGFHLAYVSPRLLANQFLASDNQGLLSVSEYARFFRYISTETNAKLIADIQAGFGNQLNTYFAGKELGASGAQIIMLNDQVYPAHSQTPNHFISDADLLGKLVALQDSQADYDFTIWLKLDGVQFYGLAGLAKRIKIAQKLGITQIIIGHLDLVSYQLIQAAPELANLIISQDNDQLALADLMSLDCQAVIPDFTAIQNLKTTLKEELSYEI